MSRIHRGKGGWSPRQVVILEMKAASFLLQHTFLLWGCADVLPRWAGWWQGHNWTQQNHGDSASNSPPASPNHPWLSRRCGGVSEVLRQVRRPNIEGAVRESEHMYSGPCLGFWTLSFWKHTQTRGEGPEIKKRRPRLPWFCRICLRPARTTPQKPLLLLRQGTTVLRPTRGNLRECGNPSLRNFTQKGKIGKSSPPPSKKLLTQKIPEELFSGWLRRFRVINYAKKFSEKYFLGSYVNFA